MKRIQIHLAIPFAIIHSIALLTGCEESQTTLTIRVYDATTWNVSTDIAEPVSGAAVIIKNGSGVFQSETDLMGTVSMKGLKNGMYYIRVDSGLLSNLLMQVTENNEIRGFVTDGIFRSQEEIRSQPFIIYPNGDTVFAQPGAQIGDVRLMDINHDAMLNADDRTSGYEYDHHQDSEIEIWIGNKNHY